MKKMVSCIATGTLLALVLSGCGQKIEAPSAETTAKIGVVFTTAGLGDNNFNDMVDSGMKSLEG